MINTCALIRNQASTHWISYRTHIANLGVPARLALIVTGFGLPVDGRGFRASRRAHFVYAGGASKLSLWHVAGVDLADADTECCVLQCSQPVHAKRASNSGP